MRTATVERNTKETQIKLSLCLDGGDVSISTGIGFFDHMLTAFAVHGGFGLILDVKGDLEVDTHHTVEDTGIALGNAFSQALGDYYAGPNHVLPTSGTARFFSPLGVDSFVKKSSFIYYTPAELRNAADDIIKLAETEGLSAHANSIKVRFN